jgi:hypothetical protein
LHGVVKYLCVVSLNNASEGPLTIFPSEAESSLFSISGSQESACEDSPEMMNVDSDQMCWDSMQNPRNIQDHVRWGDLGELIQTTPAYSEVFSQLSNR